MPISKSDYHIHTSCSPDGHNTMEELCEAAIQKGFTEIAFTDHFECYTPGYYSGNTQCFFTIPYLERYFERFEKCAQKYGNRLTLRRGIELGQPHVNPETAKEVLGRFSFDVVIGSMHKINNVDLWETDYSGDARELKKNNYEKIEQMVQTMDFDVFAHLDILKRYSTQQGHPMSVAEDGERLDGILKCLAERGKALEINTSGLRTKTNETNPGPSIIRRFRELGGEAVSFGSDAHRIKDLGAGIDIAQEVAVAAGFRYVAVFENRKMSFRKIV